MHSEAAWSWFSRHEDEPFFFCRLTQLGLLRLLATSAVMGKDVRTIGEAWTVYDRWGVSLPKKLGEPLRWSEPKMISVNSMSDRTAANDARIWWGVPVEDRKYGLPRIADPQATPAAVRFLSVETLLKTSESCRWVGSLGSLSAAKADLARWGALWRYRGPNFACKSWKTFCSTTES